MLKHFMGGNFQKLFIQKKLYFKVFQMSKINFGLMSTWGKNANTFKTVNNRKKCAAEVDICKAL